jgi:tetratricopeptide (TPR) repeat protein
MRRTLPIVVAILAAGLPVGSAQTAAPISTSELTPELLSKLEIASQHVKGNRLPEAIAAYSEFLTARPDMFAPYVDRGKLYFATEEYGKAAHDFTAALKLKGDLADALLHRCMAYYEAAEYAMAIADCSKYVAAAPRTLGWEPFYYKGMSHARLKQNELAVTELNKAFEVKNDLPEAHLFLGQLYLNQHQLLSALREFSIVIQQRPGDKEALTRRSAIKASLGDELGAREDTAKAR